MSMIRCMACEGIFDTDADPDCWVGPNDEPVCERCREEDASYENQAHPMPKDVNRLTQRPHGKKGTIERLHELHKGRGDTLDEVEPVEEFPFHQTKAPWRKKS